jgi:hypothetical protein
MEGLEKINDNLFAFFELIELISNLNERVNHFNSLISELSNHPIHSNDSVTIPLSQSEEAEYEELEDLVNELRTQLEALNKEFSFQSIRNNGWYFSGKIIEILDDLVKRNPEGELSDWITVLKELEKDKGEPITVPISKLDVKSKEKFRERLNELKLINSVSEQYTEVNKQKGASIYELAVINLLKSANLKLQAKK